MKKMSVPTLSSSAILSLLTIDQQEDLYYLLKKKHIERRSEEYVTCQDRAGEVIDKYFDLVWYARKNDNDREEIPEVDKHMTRIEEAYPQEIHELTVHTPDWSHGFSSGALAISRLLSAYACDSDESDSDEDDCDCGECNLCERDFHKFIESRKGQINMAEDEFPMLDT